MADERRVHPDCRNSSNPCHECSEYCFKVIAETRGRVLHPDCKKASNPYHECSVYCLRVIAETQALTDLSQSGSPPVYEPSDDADVKGLSSILQSIFDKYGDVAASCRLESVAIRSYYLKCICYVVQELKCTSVKQLTSSKVKEMLAMLKDVESSGIMAVGWLRLMLNECAESIDLASQLQAFEREKGNCDHDMKSRRKDLEYQKEALCMKEKEAADIKKRVSVTRAHLRELELKSSILSNVFNASPMRGSVQGGVKKSGRVKHTARRRGINDRADRISALTARKNKTRREPRSLFDKEARKTPMHNCES